MRKRIMWCHWVFAMCISFVSCGFVGIYSKISLAAYQALHPDSDGVRPVLCDFLYFHSHWLFAVPVVLGIIGGMAIIKRKPTTACCTMLMLRLLSFLFVLLTLIVWVANACPRVNLRGVHW